MTRGVNKVVLLGRLGNDPELQSLNNGNSLTKVSIATNHAYNDKNINQLVEQTEWHRVTFFGKMAENIAKFARKGSLIYVEGRLKTDKFKGNDGTDRYATNIIANEFQFISANRDNDKNSFNQDSKNNPSELNDISNIGDEDLPF